MKQKKVGGYLPILCHFADEHLSDDCCLISYKYYHEDRNTDHPTIGTASQHSKEYYTSL